MKIMLDLSTAHMPNGSPEWGGERVVEHEYGWTCFLSGADSTEVEWLRPIWEVAARHNCILINFDRDGDVQPYFHTYDW
jgi:hypothetical protein